MFAICASGGGHDIVRVLVLHTIPPDVGKSALELDRECVCYRTHLICVLALSFLSMKSAPEFASL